MHYTVWETAEETGRRAALQGSGHIRLALEERGEASIILATGASQIRMIRCLREARGIDWQKVTGFHLDEYAGISMDHPAGFRKFLKDRFVDRGPLQQFHYIDGEGDLEAECERLSEIIRKWEIDVAFVGIGENGHLAFNDPPADFDTTAPYMVVELDEKCREQQVGEGWFSSISEVPARAVSMSVHQIMQARNIICTCPDRRKAEAVRDCVEGPVTPNVPASILQRHPRASLFLDRESASLLSTEIREPAADLPGHNNERA